MQVADAPPPKDVTCWKCGTKTELRITENTKRINCETCGNMLFSRSPEGTAYAIGRAAERAANPPLDDYIGRPVRISKQQEDRARRLLQSV